MTTESELVEMVLVERINSLNVKQILRDHQFLCTQVTEGNSEAPAPQQTSRPRLTAAKV